jgi:hypothetical protein
MAFLPLIPQPTDQLSVSQANILNNFTILGAIAGNSNVGSTTLNNTAGFNFLNLALQGGTLPSFNGNDGLWAGTYAVTGKNELWAQYQQGATQYQYPISASTLSNNPTPGTGVDSWSYLPSGMIIKQGSGTTTAGAYTYNFPTGANIPVFTQVLDVIVGTYDLTNADTNTFVRLYNFNPTQLFLYGSARTTTTPKIAGFSYIAIGY